MPWGINRGGDDGEKWQAARTAIAPSALAIVVRQSGQSGHDRALSRALSQLRPHPRGAHLGQTDYRHRADRLRSQPVQPTSSAACRACARRHPHRRRSRDGISGASNSGDRQAPDRGARPQPRLSRPGRSAVRLSARRRGADDRLRQDDTGLSDGGRNGQYARHRAVRRADARRLSQRQARRFRHRALASTPGRCGRQDRLRRIHRYRRLLRAVDRPLQHHGDCLDHERDGGSARHVAARLRRDPGALSGARPHRL